MKAVMLSIRPVWCEKIASGEKTIEVRKTKPKLELPFKVYIYCTKGCRNPAEYEWCDYEPNGVVIGEFVCDRIYCYASDFGGCRPSDPGDISTEEISKLSCLTPEELYNYEHSAEPKENCIYLIGVYGWHISQLQIYDTPKELSEFRKPCIHGDKDVGCFQCEKSGYNADMHIDCFNYCDKPPQSWYYVEDLG